MKPDEVEQVVKKCLDEFYLRRLHKLNQLTLNDTLQWKKFDLIRATGMQNASEVVEGLLAAFTFYSDEGIFDDTFCKLLSKWVSSGTVSPSGGVDTAIETADKYTVISAKSDSSILNSGQTKRINNEINRLKSRLQISDKQFDALLGNGCERKNNELSAKRHYRIRSGQAFWEEFTGDADFYLNINQLMSDYLHNHQLEYIKAYHKAINRFTKEFLHIFVTAEGAIEWEKLVDFNSGKAGKSSFTGTYNRELSCQ